MQFWYPVRFFLRILSLYVKHERKAIEQYFPMAMYNVVVTFESVDKIVNCGCSDKSFKFWTILSCAPMESRKCMSIFSLSELERIVQLVEILTKVWHFSYSHHVRPVLKCFGKERICNSKNDSRSTIQIMLLLLFLNHIARIKSHLGKGGPHGRNLSRFP